MGVRAMHICIQSHLRHFPAQTGVPDRRFCFRVACCFLSSLSSPLSLSPSSHTFTSVLIQLKICPSPGAPGGNPGSRLPLGGREGEGGWLEGGRREAPFSPRADAPTTEQYGLVFNAS